MTVCINVTCVFFGVCVCCRVCLVCVYVCGWADGWVFFGVCVFGMHVFGVCGVIVARRGGNLGSLQQGGF